MASAITAGSDIRSATSVPCRAPRPFSAPRRGEVGRERGGGRRSGGRRCRRPLHLFREHGTMQTAIAPRGDARTYLTHFVGGGLDDERYVVEKFRSLANGDIVPVHADGTKSNGRRKARGDDRPAEGGRADAPGARRDHHRDRGQAAQLRGAAMGLAQPGDFCGPPATGLTGALSRTPRRPDAGGASIVPILPPTWSSRWPIGTVRSDSSVTANVSIDEPPNVLPPAYASSAASSPPRPTVLSATPAQPGATRPRAPAMPG